MDTKRVEEIKATLKAKDTTELLDIWRTNDRYAYTDEAFETIKLLLSERSVALPPQSIYVPTEDRPEYYQWELSKVKRSRTVYLTLFLLMIAANIGGNFVISGGMFFGNLVIGILFLISFMGIARKVLHDSVGTIIGYSFVILFIPFFSLLTIMIIDKAVYKAIKKKECLVVQQSV